MPIWRTAHASVVGTSHLACGVPCQDAGGCKVIVGQNGEEVLVAAVADGAGSAPYSEQGSRSAVESFLHEFGQVAAENPSLAGLEEANVHTWLRRLRDHLGETARTAGNSMCDYACTFLGAVIAPTRAMFIQIGDGAIVVREAGADEHSWVFWPQNGEFANTTNFITQDDYQRVLQVEFAPIVPVEIAMFSDGIERLVLDMRAKVVHSPALRPIFEWLSRTPTCCDPLEESSGLAAFLGSKGVNNRTDDDKTLVMATWVGMGSDG